MNKKIRKIYRTLLSTALASESDAVAGSAPGSNSEISVTRIIRAGAPVLKKRRIKLREDGRLLVSLLIKYMILEPVTRAQVRTAVEIQAALERDLATILSKVKYDRGREVSGHSILRAIEASWDDLDVNDFGIWH